MTEQARVTAYSQGLVTLSCSDDGSCSSCAGKGFCNVQGKTYTAVNSNNLNIAPGDDVEVYLPPGKTILSGFMVMMMPLIMFALGFLFVSALLGSGSELHQALGGFTGLALGFLLSYVYGRSQKKRSQPEIIRVIKKQTP